MSGDVISPRATSWGYKNLHQDCDTPDIDLVVPRYSQKDFWGPVLVRHNKIRVGMGFEASFPKVAEHGRAKLTEGIEISRSVYKAVPINFVWSRMFPGSIHVFC